MSLSSASVWEVRPTNGSDTNGGGFVAGASGTDFSQQNAKNTVGNNISTTDVVATGVATITSATASFTSAIVGNIIHLSGSGLTTGWYQVATFTNSTTVILDRSPGTGTGGAMNIGGALQTLTQLNTNFAAGHVGWVKAESTITTTAVFTFNFLSNLVYSFIAGYTTTRGDNGQVTIQASSGSSFNLVAFSNNGGQQTVSFSNFIADSNSLSGVSGFNTTSGGVMFRNCISKNMVGPTGPPTGFSIDANGARGSGCVDCTVTTSDTVTGFACNNNNCGTFLVRCQFLSNTSVHGSSIAFQCEEGTVLNCIAANSSGSTTDGFQVSSGTASLIISGCVAYTLGRDGFRYTLAGYPAVFQNCISVSNGGWGFNNATGTTLKAGVFIDFNATFGNTSGAYNGFTPGPNAVTLTGDPFVAGASNNFALNSTTGEGAACRAAGVPGVMGTSTGFLDIGSIQSAAGGGGTTVYVVNKNVTNLIEERA